MDTSVAFPLADPLRTLLESVQRRSRAERGSASAPELSLLPLIPFISLIRKSAVRFDVE
jgi:hypothetical protein